jgi:hypothetical protein
LNPEFPIRHAHDDELHLYIFGRMSAGEVKLLERHLSECGACNDKLGATAQLVARILKLSRDDASPNRRTEPRFHVSDVVFLRSLAPLLLDRWPVQIIDVSKSGLGLLVPTRLLPDVIVQVQSGTTFALGEVRHSKQINERQFHTGIMLQDVIGARRSPSAALRQA